MHSSMHSSSGSAAGRPTVMMAPPTVVRIWPPAISLERRVSFTMWYSCGEEQEEKKHGWGKRSEQRGLRHRTAGSAATPPVCAWLVGGGCMQPHAVAHARTRRLIPQRRHAGEQLFTPHTGQAFCHTHTRHAQLPVKHAEDTNRARVPHQDFTRQGGVQATAAQLLQERCDGVLVGGKKGALKARAQLTDQASQLRRGGGAAGWLRGWLASCDDLQCGSGSSMDRAAGRQTCGQGSVTHAQRRAAGARVLLFCLRTACAVTRRNAPPARAPRQPQPGWSGWRPAAHPLRCRQLHPARHPRRRRQQQCWRHPQRRQQSQRS